MIINFHSLEFCLKSFYELQMSFNGLCECACVNLISKVNFNLLDRTDLLIRLHVISKSHSKVLRDKKVIASFWVFGQNFC